MREILFRGKSVNDGEWVCGSLVITTLEPVDDAPIKHYHIEDMTIGCFPNEFQSGLSETVDPNAVGQFTGLTDKNGKKIFEGDVIKFHKFRNEPDWVGVVTYDNCQYMAKGTMPLAYEKQIGREAFYCPFEVCLSGIDTATIKVIGNIHDNPELLEGK